MDPSIQVAFISVLATAITTAGVIAVAVINNRKEREGAASAGVEAALDERDVLERMLSLIGENERKDKTISQLKDQIRQLQTENTLLRLQSPRREDK